MSAISKRRRQVSVKPEKLIRALWERSRHITLPWLNETYSFFFFKLRLLCWLLCVIHGRVIVENENGLQAIHGDPRFPWFICTLNVFSGGPGKGSSFGRRGSGAGRLLVFTRKHTLLEHDSKRGMYTVWRLWFVPGVGCRDAFVLLAIWEARWVPYS